MSSIFIPELAKYIHRLMLVRSTGYGYHADYVFGWKGDSLQKAVNQRCSLNTCSALTTQDQSVGNKCTKKPSYGPPNLHDCKFIHYLRLLCLVVLPLTWLVGVPHLPGKMKVTYA